LVGACRERQKARLALREKDKKVLLLGAGYVSAPVVDYLTRDKHISVTVGKTHVTHSSHRPIYPPDARVNRSCSVRSNRI